MIHLRRTMVLSLCRNARCAGTPMFGSFVVVMLVFSLTAVVLMMIPHRHPGQGTPAIRQLRSFTQWTLANRSSINTAQGKKPADPEVNSGPGSETPNSLSKPTAPSWQHRDQHSPEPQAQSKVVPGSVWDTSAQDDDRILQQLKYAPRHWHVGSPVTILVWGMIGGEELPEGRVKFQSDRCPVDNCVILKTASEDVHVDAILTSSHVDANHPLRLDRRPEDVWIYYNLESPESVSTFGQELDNTFNWTATYRHDSTIVTPYEKWVPFQNFSQEQFSIFGESEIRAGADTTNYAKGKTKMAAAIISNCDARGRLQLIQKLLAHNVSVDLYGACGLPCWNCFQMVRREYKFYLSFENSNCVDYISEKFFKNALQHDALPIVFGARPADYKRSAPPMSYIHVEDFPSVKHLAAYIKAVDADDELYNSYFRWKGTGRFINTKFWCRLCAMLNDPDKPRLEATELTDWWVRGGQCRQLGEEPQDDLF